MKKQEGFTLIEAAVAIAVVAILSGIIVPLVVKNINDAKIARAKNDVAVIAAAVASQYKDTAIRPVAAAGATSVWVSGGTAATTPLALLDATANSVATAANVGITQTAAAGALASSTIFLQLFNNTNAIGNTEFGLTGSEFKYQGPYLAADAAAKVDPWGNAYMIFNYNSTGQGLGTGIYVVCAGPDGRVTSANIAAILLANGVWTNNNAGNQSYDDIVTRLN